MKLLVFANVPPPHHGQSYMVQLMLNGFGGDHRWGRRKTTVEPPSRFGIECYHVDARLSRDLKDIGKFRAGKFFLLFGYCLQAIWCRFRYGVVNFYYVPAPGKRSALYRDWLVMFLCRPFFRKIIFHWHAAGLPEWLETVASIRARNLTHRLMKNSDVSIVVSEFNRRDAEKFNARRICVVNNGIPDPCPDFATSVQPRRRARFAAHGKLLANERLDAQEMAAAGGDPQIIRVLFLAHCSHDKGLFAAVEGVMAANRQLAARGSVVRIKLTIAGGFVTAKEKVEFDRLVQTREYAETVEYLGFVSGAEKRRILSEADLFCFPTCYFGENQPVNLIEAMAFGLPIVTTRWRSIPEILPPDYPGFVDPKSPGQIADALQRLAGMNLAESLREIFVHRFTLERHLVNLAKAIHSLENP